MDRAWTVVDQADPQAIAWWNEYAEGNLTNIGKLRAILEEDFPTFCALVLKVRPKGGGWLARFLFNQVQRRMWRAITRCVAEGRPIWFVVLKFRQAGMSTFWCAWLFWQMWRQKDIQEMVVAHQLATAETMIETQRVFYDELPEIFKPDLREGNHGASIPRGEIYFKDRRSWQMVHLSKNVDPRGQQVTHVLETELAMYHNPSELNGALLPQLPAIGSEASLRSSFIIESTPKGQNDFYDYYKRAKEGKAGLFQAIFFPWFLFDEQYAMPCPAGFKLNKEERDEQKRLSQMRKYDYSPEDGGGVPVTDEQMCWRRETIRSHYNDNEEMFDQEYPSDEESCWLLSEKSVFKDFGRDLLEMCDQARTYAQLAWSGVSVDGETVKANGPMRVKLLPNVERDKLFTPIDPHVPYEIHAHGRWLVWEPPVRGHKYCIGGDPAMGVDGGDNSCCSVIDVTEGRQVAEWTDNVGPEEMAIQMAAAGYWYNQALLVPEVNSLGFVLLNRLTRSISYPLLYKWPKWDEVNKYSPKRGFETNNRTKQLMVAAMVHYFEHRIVTIASRDLLGELSVFEQKSEDGGQYVVFGAQKGRHDDRVMAFGMALMGIEQTPILLTERNRNAARVPTAQELHLAPALSDPSPLPKRIEELIAVKHNIPWNPINSEGIPA